MNELSSPSAYRVEAAMSAAAQVRQRLAAIDPTIIEDAGLLADTLDGETDALELVRRLVRYSLEQQSLADAAEARAQDLSVRRARFEARVAAARETVKQMLDALGVNRVVDSEFTVSLKLAPPKVNVTEPEKLADEFWRIQTTRTVDKPLVKAALDAGREVEGAVLGNGGLSLQIRTK